MALSLRLCLLSLALTSYGASLSNGYATQTVFSAPSTPLNETYQEQWFEQPLDHFTDSGHVFQQRYWVSDKHYSPGGPIFILDGGETSGEDRLPFLDTGIVNILANATKGFGIILEHRYYGKSVPVKNLTTDSLRWLNNAQSAEDSANFIRNLNINGSSALQSGPIIYYGGSYAGARAAHMRILYPDLVYGAIASSAVVHAQFAMPEYHEVIRKAASPECTMHIENSIRIIDRALSIPVLNKPIKGLFGLEDLEDVDFAGSLMRPLGAWQGKIWDPAVGSTKFDEFCTFLAKQPGTIMMLHGEVLDFALLNYAQWIRENQVDPCDEPVTQCLTTDYADVSLDAEWRKWFYQTCTEWGYYQSAPEDPSAPRIVSSLITAEAIHSDCFKAFPPGEFNSIPARPNVSVVNDLGDFSLTADRLAFIDGEVDPWRPATPHSEYALPRNDTLDRPFKLIPNGVHHYDEYGLKDITKEPPEIYAIHMEMIEFVQHWIKSWNSTQ